MTHKEKIDAVLHAVRHAKGNERLLKLGFGCRFIELGSERKLIYLNKWYSTESCLACWVYDGGYGETLKADVGGIIGHPVKWSDVLVAITESGSMVRMYGSGTLEFYSRENMIEGIDLTLTPEEAMQKDEDLTNFLFKLLIDKV